jgi:hypothetical protein
MKRESINYSMHPGEDLFMYSTGQRLYLVMIELDYQYLFSVPYMPVDEPSWPSMI